MFIKQEHNSITLKLFVTDTLWICPFFSYKSLLRRF